MSSAIKNMIRLGLLSAFLSFSAQAMENKNGDPSPDTHLQELFESLSNSGLKFSIDATFPTPLSLFAHNAKAQFKNNAIPLAHGCYSNCVFEAKNSEETKDLQYYFFMKFLCEVIMNEDNLSEETIKNINFSTFAEEILSKLDFTISNKLIYWDILATSIIKAHNNFNNPIKDIDVIKAIALLLARVLDYRYQQGERVMLSINSQSFFIFANLKYLFKNETQGIMPSHSQAINDVNIQINQ